MTCNVRRPVRFLILLSKSLLFLAMERLTPFRPKRPECGGEWTGTGRTRIFIVPKVLRQKSRRLIGAKDLTCLFYVIASTCFKCTCEDHGKNFCNFFSICSALKTFLPVLHLLCQVVKRQETVFVDIWLHLHRNTGRFRNKHIQIFLRYLTNTRSYVFTV